MKAILILGAVLLALGALLRLVRLGALAEYSAAGLRLKLKVGPLRLMLYPRKPKRPRRRLGNRPEGRKREERPQPELGGGPLALVKRFLPLIAEAAGASGASCALMCSSLKLPRRRRTRCRRPVLRRGERIYRYDLAAGGAEF